MSQPPNIYFLTPNGRFELNKKICLSITGYHPEYWRPAWGVRSSLIALISFMTTSGDGAIAALDYTEEERAHYAKLSRSWECAICGSKNATALPDEKDAPSLKLEADPELTFSVRPEYPKVNSEDESVTTDSLFNAEKREESPTMSLTLDTEQDSSSSLPSPPHTAEPLREPEIRLRKSPPSTLPASRSSTTFVQQKSRVDSALMAILMLVLVILARRFIAFYLSHL
jgi:ubiquitin-conjugating enzyme E2 J1